MNTKAEHALKIEHVSKTFSRTTAVDDVNFDFVQGVLGLVGPSGCGKTTLLRCIAGLEVPDKGRISIHGKVETDIGEGLLRSPYLREIGFVFQNYALWPHMTNYENIAFGLRRKKVPESEIKSRIKAVLDLIDLQGQEKKYPSQISGGQQQRVALARSIIMEPKLLLLDEPLSNLDAKLRVETRIELRRLIKKVGISAVHVTHDQEEAFALSDLLIVMNKGQMQQFGSPAEIFEKPANTFVASFVGKGVVVAGKITGTTGGSCAVMIPELDNATLVCNSYDEVAVGSDCQLVIRPFGVELDTEKLEGENVLKGTLIDTEDRGEVIDYRIEIGRRELTLSSHKSCPRIHLHRQTEQMFLRIDRSMLRIVSEA